ncbi:MAG: pyridoxal-phosphate dependent enzyme [Balneolaceae bacterium]
MRSTLTPPSLLEIEKANSLISNYAHNTPVFTSMSFNERTNASVYFKCENFQRVGAFKFRGACNAVMSLTEEDAKFGVATHSSGNHAQALALSAKLRGIKAYVVMPENAPKVKVAAVKGYSAEVTFCESTLAARESTLQEVVSRTQATIIHPYNDARIVAGQGTAALELLRSHPDLDVIMTPVGGGGLLSGTAIAAKALKPSIQVIGAEPANVDDAYRSFYAKKLIPVTRTDTIADGLRTSLGELPFSIILNQVDDIITTTEKEIVEAMRFIWERMNIIIEPSSAVPAAVILNNPSLFKNKKVGVIVSGGNVDLGNLPW